MELFGEPVATIEFLYRRLKKIIKTTVMLDFVQRRAWHYLFLKPKCIFSYVKVYKLWTEEDTDRWGEVEVATFQREKIKEL